MIKIFIKMEEDNDLITGWDDNDLKILNVKNTKKHHKNMTHSIVADQDRLQRKIKPSRTLPIIKNKPTFFEQTHSEPLEKKQYTQTDKLYKILEDRMARTKKTVILKQYLDSLDSLHTSQTTPKQQDQILIEQKDPKESENEQNSTIHKKIGQVKHGSTIVKIQKISRIDQLKIQANEYVSSAKNTPRATMAEKTEMLKKISKGSLANLNKKEKNKQFVVKKQRLSPQQLSQEVSKMAIELRKSSDQDLKLHAKKERKGYFMKEKYKDTIKPTEMEKEKEKEKKNNPLLIKSQSQQFKNSTHARRSTNFQVGRSTCKNDSKIVACKEPSFSQCIGQKDRDHCVNRISKWDQVLKEVQNEAKTLKKLKDNQKKLLKQAKQSTTGLLPSFNQKSNMLEIMVTKRLRNDIMKAESKVINSLKRTLTKEVGQGEFYTMLNEKMITEGSTCYDEFSDQFLFCHRGNYMHGNEGKAN